MLLLLIINSQLLIIAGETVENNAISQPDNQRQGMARVITLIFWMYGVLLL